MVTHNGCRRFGFVGTVLVYLLQDATKVLGLLGPLFSKLALVPLLVPQKFFGLFFSIANLFAN